MTTHVNLLADINIKCTCGWKGTLRVMTVNDSPYVADPLQRFTCRCGRIWEVGIGVSEVLPDSFQLDEEELELAEN